MTRSTFMKVGLAALTVTAAGALGFASTEKDRPDCPGKIVCPLTGELVCLDQCPNLDTTQIDFQNELSTDTFSQSTLPPCCAKNS